MCERIETVPCTPVCLSVGLSQRQRARGSSKAVQRRAMRIVGLV